MCTVLYSSYWGLELGTKKQLCYYDIWLCLSLSAHWASDHQTSSPATAAAASRILPSASTSDSVWDIQTDRPVGGVEGIIAGPFKKRGGHFVLRQKGNNALLSVGFVSARNVLFVPLLVHMHTYKVTTRMIQHIRPWTIILIGPIHVMQQAAKFV